MRLRTPGGGGYGDPFTRDPAAVLRDVRNQVLSIAVAREQYGVVIVSGADGPVVDTAATGQVRDSRPTPAFRQFDPGPGRAAHEALFTPAVADALAELLYSLPSGMRYYAKGKMYARIRAQAESGATVTVEMVKAMQPELMASMGLTEAVRAQVASQGL